MVIKGNYGKLRLIMVINEIDESNDNGIKLCLIVKYKIRRCQATFLLISDQFYFMEVRCGDDMCVMEFGHECV